LAIKFEVKTIIGENRENGENIFEESLFGKDSCEVLVPAGRLKIILKYEDEYYNNKFEEALETHINRFGYDKTKESVDKFKPSEVIKEKP
jgi:hypothetical protein